MKSIYLLFAVVALLLCSLSVADPREDAVDDVDEFEYEGSDLASKAQGILSFELEHNLGAGSAFTKRGKVTIELDAKERNTVSFVENDVLDKKYLSAIDDMNKKDAFYKIRVRSNPRDPSSPYVVASLPACHVINSFFRDDFYFHLSKERTLVALEYRTPASYLDSCRVDSTTWMDKDHRFSSKGVVVDIQEGPTVPRQFEAKTKAPPGMKEVKPEKGEKGDEPEPSFLRKYWYIILPVTLMTLLGGDPQQGQAAQGGGGSAGGGGARR